MQHNFEKGVTPPWLVGKTWQKGVSGNPHGVPKAVKAARDLAVAATPEAMERLKQLMRQDDDLPVALAATREILARGLGKHIEPEKLWPKKVGETVMPVSPQELTSDQLTRIVAIAKEGLP